MKQKKANQGTCKILIIRFSSMGDILLTTPFIRQIRNNFPDATIYYVTKKKYHELLKYNENIDHIIVYSKRDKKCGLRAIKRFIKKERIHYIFDLHNNFRSNYLRRNSKAEYVNHIRKDKLKQVALVSFKKNYYDSIIPIPERYFQVGKDFGLMPDSKGLELFWNDDYYGKVEHFIQNKGINPEENYISIAPGASFDNKKWPIEYFEETIQEVSKELKCRVVVLGDKNDQELGKRLADNNDNVYDMTGQLSMLESAIVMSKSIALLSNDSGLMHMATAVNTPVLAIFGPTVRELGFFPYKAIHSVVEMKNLQCRPCSHMGKNRCPKKHFRCMRDITPEIVYKNLIQLVRGN